MKRFYWIMLFLLLFSSIYLYLYYNILITDSCVDVLGADTKLHFTDAFMFMQNFEKYGMWYPVNFSFSSLGSYWEDHPLALPLQFLFLSPLLLFFTFSKAFYLGYLLFFVLLIISVYVFFSKITNEFYAALISFSLLVLPHLNKPFSVGGNYPFFVSLPFFFFALFFFYNSFKENKKQNLILFAISAIAAGYTYIFTLFFLLTFTVIYSIIKKNYKLLWLLGLILLSTSLFNLPVFLNYEPQLYQGHGSIPTTVQEKFTDLINVFKPVNSPFSFIYSPFIENIDTNHGLGIILLVLISILYVVMKKDFLKDENLIFLLILWAVVLVWVILLTTFTYLSTFDPSERVITLFVLLSFLVGAYVLYKFKINWYAFSVFTLIWVASFLYNQSLYFGAVMFAVLFAIMIYFSNKHSDLKFLIKSKDFQHVIFSFMILFLLFFPMTGMTESSTLYPRNNIFIQDVFSKYMNENDTFLFLGSYPSEYSISVCSNSKTVYSHRHFSRDKQEKIINEIKIELGKENYQPLFSAMEKYKITKLIFNPIFQKEKVLPISNKYGIPKLIEGKAVSIGKLYNLPYLIFNIQNKPLPYTIEIINPTKLIVRKDTALDNFEILLSYNKKWKAGEGTLTESPDGLVNLQNVSGKSEVVLTYDTSMYILALIISLFSILGIIIYFKKNF